MKANWKRFLALFLALAMVVVSGVVLTNGGFKAADVPDQIEYLGVVYNVHTDANGAYIEVAEAIYEYAMGEVDEIDPEILEDLGADPEVIEEITGENTSAEDADLAEGSTGEGSNESGEGSDGNEPTDSSTSDTPSETSSDGNTSSGDSTPSSESSSTSSGDDSGSSSGSDSSSSSSGDSGSSSGGDSGSSSGGDSGSSSGGDGSAVVYSVGSTVVGSRDIQAPLSSIDLDDKEYKLYLDDIEGEYEVVEEETHYLSVTYVVIDQETEDVKSLEGGAYDERLPITADGKLVNGEYTVTRIPGYYWVDTHIERLLDSSSKTDGEYGLDMDEFDPVDVECEADDGTVSTIPNYQQAHIYGAIPDAGSVDSDVEVTFYYIRDPEILFANIIHTYVDGTGERSFKDANEKVLYDKKVPIKIDGTLIDGAYTSPVIPGYYIYDQGNNARGRLENGTGDMKQGLDMVVDNIDEKIGVRGLGGDFEDPLPRQVRINSVVCENGKSILEDFDIYLIYVGSESTYTIKYVDGAGNALKPPTPVKNAFEGEDIDLILHKEAFSGEDGKNYRFVSSTLNGIDTKGADSVKLAKGGNEIVLTFEEDVVPGKSSLTPYYYEIDGDEVKTINYGGKPINNLTVGDNFDYWDVPEILTIDNTVYKFKDGDKNITIKEDPAENILNFYYVKEKEEEEEVKIYKITLKQWVEQPDGTYELKVVKYGARVPSPLIDADTGKPAASCIFETDENFNSKGDIPGLVTDYLYSDEAKTQLMYIDKLKINGVEENLYKKESGQLANYAFLKDNNECDLIIDVYYVPEYRKPITINQWVKDKDGNFVVEVSKSGYVKDGKVYFEVKDEYGVITYPGIDTNPITDENDNPISAVKYVVNNIEMPEKAGQTGYSFNTVDIPDEVDEVVVDIYYDITVKDQEIKDEKGEEEKEEKKEEKPQDNKIIIPGGGGSGGGSPAPADIVIQSPAAPSAPDAQPVPQIPGVPVEVAEANVPAEAAPEAAPVAETPVFVVPVTPVAIQDGEVPVGEIVSDADGNISINEIDDIEAALANQDLGHICNILYFLILLATTIALFCYYRSIKKHNEHIFELRHELGEDDPYKKDNK